MDIPRIGSGGYYRPAQAWPGRTAEPAGEEAVPAASTQTGTVGAPKAEPKAEPKTGTRASGSKRAPGEPLTEDEQKQVDKLKAIDTKVRQHEAAHQAAGGAQAGGATFSYAEGPDGQRYAVGGEVPIRSGGGSADAKVAQLEQMKRAALAPADPSGQDLAVAAAATASIAEARKDQNATPEAGGAGQADGQGGQRDGAARTGGETDAAKARPGSAAQGPGSAPSWDSNGAIPAHVARGMAAYGSAARLNPVPTSAAGFFA